MFIATPPALVDCEHHARVRPASVVVACADTNFYFSGLKWKRWDERGAVATGVAHANDCTPNCASGTFHTYKAELRLSRSVTCNQGRLVFSRYWWRRDGPKPRYGAEIIPCRFLKIVP